MTEPDGLKDPLEGRRIQARATLAIPGLWLPYINDKPIRIIPLASDSRSLIAALSEIAYNSVMQTYTLPDITPNGSVVNLGTAAASAGVPTRAVWVNMTATGSSIRVGDAAIGAARGQVLPTGVPFLVCPRGDNPQTPYDLSKINVYGGSGSDKVSITYGY